MRREFNLCDATDCMQSSLFVQNSTAVKFPEFFRRRLGKFSDLKRFEKSKQTKNHRHSWGQRVKISITAKFGGEIL